MPLPFKRQAHDLVGVLLAVMDPRDVEPIDAASESGSHIPSNTGDWRAGMSKNEEYRSCKLLAVLCRR